MIINEQLLFTVTVDRELKNGNTGRTKHFSQAIKEKKGWANALKKADVVTETGLAFPLPAFIEDVLNGQPVQQEVGLVVKRVLGKRQRYWDADSALRGAKELVDAVVDTGLLVDDNMKHVAWCLGLQDDSRKEQGPFVELLFYGAEA
jgi:hypothetical protein